jgi:hypothetical protein
MKRKTSSRLQGDLFPDFLNKPAVNASAVGTDRLDTDAQPGADFKDLQNQPIEQASTPSAVSEDAVEPVCGTSEGIAPGKAVFAHVCEEEPTPGAVSQADPFAASTVGDTATATGSTFSAVAPEAGQYQFGSDDLSGRPRTSVNTGVGAAVYDCIVADLSETPMPVATGKVARVYAGSPQTQDLSEVSETPGNGGEASAGGSTGLTTLGSGSKDESTATGSNDGVNCARAIEPGVSGNPKDVARDRMGEDQIDSVPGGEELDAGDVDVCRPDAKSGETSIPKMSPSSAEGLIGVSLKSVGETESLPHGEDMTNEKTPILNGLIDETQSSKPLRRGRKPIYDELPYYFASSPDDGIVKPIPRHVYFRMVNDLTEGDQHPLRKLWLLAELEKTNIVNLSLKKVSLAALLTKHKLHSNPKRFAGQILICFKRLVERHPTILTTQHESVVDTRVHPLPEDRVPKALRDDIAAWLAKVPVKVEGGRNVANALAVDTIESYVRSVHTIAAALALSGVRLDPTVDIAFLVQRSAIMRWLKYLKKSMKRSTMRGLIAALLRIATDLPDKSKADIEFLRARLKDYMDDLALDGDELVRLAKWVEPEKHCCLLSAPHQLMEAAENSRKWPARRMLDSAAAFAFICMWEHPGLSEGAIAAFDLATHIVGEPGSRKVLRFRGARERQPSKWVEETLSPEAEGILDRLIALRASMSVTTTLLLPGEDGRPRRVSSAMEVLYTKIQGILAERLNSSDLRDLNAYIALDDKSADLAEIADGLGYKNARSLERRFGEHARRTSPTSGEA